MTLDVFTLQVVVEGQRVLRARDVRVTVNITSALERFDPATLAPPKSFMGDIHSGCRPKDGQPLARVDAPSRHTHIFGPVPFVIMLRLENICFNPATVLRERVTY
jgi:hypothetical protein